uniref:Endonuclease/exonuclease/phosphatase domain-containing protein n=1 Tax=Ananas comosus var. bracteatus TaxID=296719 RepID=A0A6V7NF57_ANACO|nr:unnamed protein product [Ananas comosus var. bracteatus]
MDPGRNSPIHYSSLSVARLPLAFPTRHLALQTGPSSNRTSAAPAFLPPRPPPAGNLTSRVVWRVSISLPGFRIRLLNWSILCWNEEDVKAAVSGFGELWEVDGPSDRHTNVSFFRLMIRYQDVLLIPEAIDLMVEDRQFYVPIEIESFEEANPILLGKGLDEHLGLNTLEAQETFIRQTGFSSVPPYLNPGSFPILQYRDARSRHRPALGQHSPTPPVHRRRLRRPIGGFFQNTNLEARDVHSDRGKSALVNGIVEPRDQLSTSLLALGSVPYHADATSDPNLAHPTPPSLLRPGLGGPCGKGSDSVGDGPSARPAAVDQSNLTPPRLGPYLGLRTGGRSAFSTKAAKSTSAASSSSSSAVDLPHPPLLQQTSNEQHKTHLRIFHLRVFRTLDADGTRGGILTAWNSALFDCVHEWVGLFSLTVVLKRNVDGRSFTIYNIYGSTAANLKPTFFQELRSINVHSVGEWTVLGDFNVLLSANDKTGPTTSISDILKFREVVHELGLVDLPILNKSFTWTNGRCAPTLERLDRAFVSSDWLLAFPRSTLRALP